MSLSPHSAGGSIWAFGAGSRACRWLPARTPLSSHTVSPRAGDWDYLGRSEPTVGSFPSLQRTSLLPLGSFSHQGKHRRHTGRHCLRSFTGPAPAPRGGPGGPPLPFGLRGCRVCRADAEQRAAASPGSLPNPLLSLSLPAPSLARFPNFFPERCRHWPAGRSGCSASIPESL